MHTQLLMTQEKARGRKRRRQELGATLTELLIATVIFGFLTMILLGVINFGSNSWRTLEGRSSAQKEARLAVLDLTRTVRNTDIRTFSCGNTTNGTKSCNWMCFKTMQAVDLARPEILAFNVENPPGTYSSGANRFKWSYFVLYYAIPPDNCGCAAAEPTYTDNDGNATTASDGVKYDNLLNTQTYKCPHKLLIKKFLAFNDATLPPLSWPVMYRGGDTSIKGIPASYTPTRRYLTATDIKPYLTLTTVPNQVNTAVEKAVIRDCGDPSVKANCVTQIAKNILVFAVNYYDPFSSPKRGDSSLAAPAEMPEVQFTVKTFKIMENRSYRPGVVDLNLGPKSLSLQIDEKIIPVNNNCENLQ